MLIRQRTTSALLRAVGVSIGAALVVTSPWLAAQTGMAPQGPQAVAPGASGVQPALPGRPTPKVTAPSDAQRSLDLNNPQPEGKVAPQIRIPLGKKGDTPIFQRRRPDPAAANPSANLIDDAAARCESERDEQTRIKCRDRQAHSAPK